MWGKADADQMQCSRVTWTGWHPWRQREGKGKGQHGTYIYEDAGWLSRGGTSASCAGRLRSFVVFVRAYLVPYLLEGYETPSRVYGPSFASFALVVRCVDAPGGEPSTMFKYLKQVLAPSAFEPELPPELLQTIRINAARKGSFMSSGSNASIPEFDPLIASAFELSEMLNAGAITSVEIVEAYLHQIEQHNRRGRNLRALISVAPRHELVRIARRLDDERSRGKRRGPLHGIPIVLKDNIMTEGALGMDTTVGRFEISSKPLVLLQC